MALSKRFLSVFLVATFTASSLPLRASADGAGQLMFILDASSSMLAKDGGSTTRIEKAKAALASSLTSIPAGVQAGLRAYGHRVSDTDKPNGCQDTQLLNAPAAGNAEQIKNSITGIQAKGWTPIGASLQAVRNDFKGEGAKSVILISDGIDTCAPPDPCETAKALAATGVNIKINTLGLVVNNQARAQLTCIAEATGGNYFDVSDINQLNAIVGAVTTREASLFSAQGIPIKGSPRYEQAPRLLPGTSYTDDIVGGEELYYGFDVLPQQKVTITVRTGNAQPFGNLDIVSLNWYNASTGEQINVGREIGQFALLKKTASANLVLKAAAPEDLTSPGVFAVKVKFKSNVANTPLPLEIKVTTEGGTAPGNQTNEANSAEETSAAKKPPKPPLFVAAGILVPLIAGAIAAYYLIRKKRQTKNPPAVLPPTDPPNTIPTL